MLSFGHTAKCHTIFPLKISPEIQWACPFGQIQIPNTNPKYKYKYKKPKMLSFGCTSKNYLYSLKKLFIQTNLTIIHSKTSPKFEPVMR